MRPHRHATLFLVCCLGLALAGANVVRGEVAGMTGDYDDEGVIASATAEPFPLGVSLRALLSLEFDPAAARQLHDEVARIRVRQAPGIFDVLMYDRSGKLVQRGWWRKEAQDGRISLLFRVKDDNYFFQFEIVAQQRLLRVTVQHSTPTSFGPNWHDVGTFLFARVR